VKRILFPALLLMPALAHAGDPTLTPALTPLQFLVGAWDASGSGKPGSSAGTFTFTVEAGGKAMVRHNASTSPQGKHEDVMLIHTESPNAVRAEYVDSEGHVIYYTVTTPDAKTVVFATDVKADAPGFRLSYHANEDGSLATKFETAPPGKTEYSTYLEGTAHRK